MSPELAMYIARMYAYVAVMEGMKADNARSLVYGDTPHWSGDHFNNIQADLECLATNMGACTS